MNNDTHKGTVFDPEKLSSDVIQAEEMQREEEKRSVEIELEEEQEAKEKKQHRQKIIFYIVLCGLAFLHIRFWVLLSEYKDMPGRHIISDGDRVLSMFSTILLGLALMGWPSTPYWSTARPSGFMKFLVVAIGFILLLMGIIIM